MVETNFSGEWRSRNVFLDQDHPTGPAGTLRSRLSGLRTGWTRKLQPPHSGCVGLSVATTTSWAERLGSTVPKPLPELRTLTVHLGNYRAGVSWGWGHWQGTSSCAFLPLSLLSAAENRADAPRSPLRALTLGFHVSNLSQQMRLNSCVGIHC